MSEHLSKNLLDSWTLVRVPPPDCGLHLDQDPGQLLVLLLDHLLRGLTCSVVLLTALLNQV